MANNNMRMSLSGDKSLMKTLDDLPGAVLNKVVTKANSTAMNPMAKALRAATKLLDLPKEQRDALAKSMGRRGKTYKKDGNVYTVLGPKFGSRYIDAAGRNLVLNYQQIEFGYVTKDGESVQAQPFMRPVWDAGKGAVESNYASAVRASIEKVAALEAKKNGKK
tara:strand:- start:10324 stop:10815 length:492 start_codon:yes stop_codon:yes gene_type:complete